MSIIFLLIGISIVVASIFLIAFLWAVKSGQYEDSYTPSIRILFDSTMSKSHADSGNKTENKNGEQNNKTVGDLK